MKKKMVEYRDLVWVVFNFDVLFKEFDGKKKMILLFYDFSCLVEDQVIFVC